MKTKSTHILIFLFSFLFCLPALSQTPDWSWARGIGANGYDSGLSVALDDAGYVYTVGFFSDSVDFNADPGFSDILVSSGDYDIFITKYDSSGNFIWAKSAGGTLYDDARGIKVDGSGNLYITGGFSGTADFNPDASGTYLLNSNGLHDMYILKLDSAGNFIWAVSAGSIQSDFFYSITLDASDDLIVVGYFKGTCDFDPSPSGTYNLVSNGNDDIAILKLDNGGNFIWAKQLGGTFADRANSVTTDANSNIIITGWFSYTADFDPGPGIFNLTSNGLFDFFILKMDMAGSFDWAASIGGVNDDNGLSVCVDNLGNIFSTGNFSGTVDFDPGASGIYNLTSQSTDDCFILALSSSGIFLWAKNFGGSGRSSGRSIFADGSGNIFTTGSFEGAVDFNPDALFDYILTSSGLSDVFVSGLNSSGNFLWAIKAGGSGFESGSSVEINNYGNMFVVGSFRSPVITFGSITLSNAQSSSSYTDIFITRINNTTTGIVAIHDNFLVVYPNPVSADLFITGHIDISEGLDYSIFTMLGKEVMKGKIFSGYINIESLFAQVYVLRLKTKTGYKNLKFVKN
jgi:hypothetical protein